jgi:DNA polymerase-3 subunit alpha
MSADFVHLHVHTDFSLLDGASSIAGLIELAKEHQMSAMAMTDHGAMGGAIDFYQGMMKAGVKPIIGCEMYISPTTRFDKDPNRPETRGFHLVLLARDFVGYQNLCRLTSAANLEGFWYKPRIDKELLATHRAGLVGLSACLKGEIADAILRNRPRDAKDRLSEYLDIFGREHFFLEVMDHGMPDQAVVNKELVLLSREFDVPLVATNDVHYLRREHAKAHDLLLCIQTRSMVADEKRMRFPNDEFYFKSEAEMAQRFAALPQALRNTVRVAEQCDLILPFAPEANHYPVYAVPAGDTQKTYLRRICAEGIRERYDFDIAAVGLTAEQQAIVARLDHEMNVIDNANYTSYFLVVWDFLKYAREQGIPVGPGRGSGAGSLVAYATHITDVEPLRYGLLFERFLNPERISPPDFDIDLCERRRGEVIEYVRNKYGRDSVAQIGTYGTLKVKAALKDTARVLGLSFQDGDKITKLVTDQPPPKDAKTGKKKSGIDWALEQSPELRQMYESETAVREVIDGARPLEDLNRNMTIHAAGVIIGDQPLHDLVPLAHGAEGEVITQYAAVPCESLGLLKMDFLGLSTLTIIRDTLDILRRTGGPDLDISRIPLDDQPTYELLNKGNTIAVFQLESSGMQDLCKKFGVGRIEDIIALIALFRPGPMQFIGDFIARKSGQTAIEYDHPAMEPILRETYGIMLYQEQIMQVVQVVAGFSLGQADILRRAIGKKKVKEMADQHGKFVAGCAARGIKAGVAQAIWEKIEKFAGYGFNKSHSAAYGILAYQTAYLKAHHPVAFMCAVLTNKIDNAEEVAFFIQECREMGIRVLPPDVDVSEGAFTVDGDAIRFGLAAIKGVGGAAAEAIINARRNGPFASLVDFCERVGSAVNTRMLECLARTGAFDRFGLRRSQLVAVIEPTIARAQEKVRDREQGQGSLFDFMDTKEAAAFDEIPVPDIPEYHEREMLSDEKALIGFYVSGHPLGEFARTLRIYASHTLAKAAQLTGQHGVKVGGIITSVHIKQSKAGNPFAVLTLEDLESSMECLVFGRKAPSADTPPGGGPRAEEDDRDRLAECRDLLVAEAPIFVEGVVDREDESAKARLMIERVLPLAEVPARYTQELHLRLYEGSTRRETLGKIRDLCRQHPGPTLTVLCLSCANGEIAFVEAGASCRVNVSPALLAQLHVLVGERDLHFKADPAVPTPKVRRWGGDRNGHGRPPADAS